MAFILNFLRRIRLVYRRSSTLLKCVVLVTILLSTAALVAMRFALVEAKQQKEDLRLQAAALVQENERLAQYIAEQGTVESVRRIAKEKLGLVDPNASFFTPIDNSNGGN